jgi:3-deoxy-D-arabino-heptulosonate 7-phosphate (DAHP) synthase
MNYVEDVSTQIKYINESMEDINKNTERLSDDSENSSAVTEEQLAVIDDVSNQASYLQEMANKLNDNIKDFTNNNDSTIIISGPCSAETESQLLLTAQQLKERITINYFRAGIWKPRTKPGMFEGVGQIGLSWLQRVKKEIGLKSIVEVANPQHVEQILKHGIDACWIGARTSVSPFAVQEIAESLKGVNIPVFIKNPVNPDLELWSGALERFIKSEISEIRLIHRGFSSSVFSEFRKTNTNIYRNPKLKSN